MPRCSQSEETFAANAASWARRHIERLGFQNSYRQVFQNCRRRIIVQPVEHPRLDILRGHEIGRGKHLHIFGDGGLAQLDLPRDEPNTDTICNKIAVALWREVLGWVRQPVKDVEAYQRRSRPARIRTLIG